MPGSEDDDRLRIANMWGIAWILGLISLLAWIYLINHLGGTRVWDSRSALALAIAVTSSLFSAGCAVLAGIRTAEARIVHELAASREGESSS